MPRTVQKKIKFTKGMITSSMAERTDLPTYDSSAELIRNYVCTPYGGFRTRRGTKLIQQLDLAEKMLFKATQTSGSFNDNNFVSASLVNNKDGDTLVVFDLGVEIGDYDRNVSPTYTKNDMGYYKVSDSRNNPNIYEVFNGTTGAFYIGGTWSGYWIKQQYPKPFTVKKYFIKADNSGQAEHPKAWKFQGSNDDKNWVTIDTQTAQTFTLGQEKKYTISSPKDFLYYRALFSDGVASGELNGFKMTGAFLKPVRSEANVYLSNIRLDYEKPSLTAEFEETGVLYNAELKKVNIVNGGLGFDGTLSVVGDVVSGETVITPILTDLGEIQSVSFSSATYKYLPESPQDVIVSATPPKCTIGFSTSSDGKIWSSEVKYEVSNTAIPSIKLTATNFRYLRVRYFGSGVRTKLRFDNLFAKYEFYKLIPFIYNISQKDLVVLSKKKILIFEDKRLVKEIEISPDLYFEDIRAVKWSQNEDVIVFTEAGVKPRELRRTTNDWEFKEFPIKNIPYHNFSGTKETEITTGITPNYEEGTVTITADGDIFEEASVGQQIDGNGGRLKITEFVGKRKVLGYTIVPFLNKEKITKWTYITGWESVWSDERGWPISCLFYQQRLWFGGSAQRPSTVWASRTGIYNDFNNAGNYDNDGINQDLNTENQIVNLLSNRGLQIFTSGDEWTAPEGKLTPNEFSVVKNTSNGSDIGLTPKNLGGVTLFIEKNGKSLLSYVYDYNQSAYTTSNIGILGSLISEPVDMEIDDNSSLDEGDYLYIVLKNGDMIITSLNFEQEINASSIFSTVGSIVSVCNLINETYLLININNNIYIQVIDDKLRTDLTIEKYVEKVITGLENYNGEYVHVYSGDEDFGKYLVENGTVELRYAVNTNCNIGFAFSSELNSNDIAINGRSTSTFKRISKAVITTKDTNKIKLNGVEKYSNDNIFDFFAVSSYGKRVKFKIESEFDKIEVLSVLLYINYGAR